MYMFPFVIARIALLFPWEYPRETGLLGIRCSAKSFYGAGVCVAIEAGYFAEGRFVGRSGHSRHISLPFR
jgi:hypothetical protein